MLEVIFPREVDNKYTGHPLAKWALIPLALLTVARSLVHILAPDGGAGSIATIPLNTYPPDAVAAVIHIFALWGLSQLLIGLLYFIVLWRFRRLIPLMYLLMVLEYGARLLFGFFKPINLAGTAPGGIANYFMVPAGIVLFIFSIWDQKKPRISAEN